MAQIVRTELVDDIDGGAAIETLSFGVDGVQYEIDLSQKHAEALRKALALYLEKGRRIGGRAARKGAGGGKASDTKAIREWANSQGIEVSDRGRISADVWAAYAAGHANGNGATPSNGKGDDKAKSNNKSVAFSTP